MNPMKIAGMAVGGFVVGILVIVFGLVGIFIFAILGALIGAITGWIVANTPLLGDAVRQGFTAVFEIESPDLVSIGAMLGFVAGFFKNWGPGGNEWKKHEQMHKKPAECQEDWASEIPEVHIDVKPKKRAKKK